MLQDCLQLLILAYLKIVILQSLPDNPSFYVNSVDFGVCWLSFTMWLEIFVDIHMLSNFGFYPKHFEHCYETVLFKFYRECWFFFFFLAGTDLVRFRLHVPTWILWIIIPTSVQFSKSL